MSFVKADKRRSQRQARTERQRQLEKRGADDFALRMEAFNQEAVARAISFQKGASSMHVYTKIHALARRENERIAGAGGDRNKVLDYRVAKHLGAHFVPTESEAVSVPEDAIEEIPQADVERFTHLTHSDENGRLYDWPPALMNLYERARPAGAAEEAGEETMKRVTAADRAFEELEELAKREKRVGESEAAAFDRISRKDLVGKRLFAIALDHEAGVPPAEYAVILSKRLTKNGAVADARELAELAAVAKRL